MSEIARFPWGYLGTYDDNELEVVSTIQDPPKIRMAVEAGKVESNLGAVSFNIKRSDGRHEEMAYLMGRLTEGGEAAAIYMATRDVGDEQGRERFFLDSRGAHFRVPVFAPNLGNEGARVGQMWSGNGRYVTQQQDDGNFVTYRVDGDQWVAIWSAWTGRIR